MGLAFFCLKMNTYNKGLDSLKGKLLSNREGGWRAWNTASVCVASASLVGQESCWCDEWNLNR